MICFKGRSTTCQGCGKGISTDECVQTSPFRPSIRLCKDCKKAVLKGSK